MDITILAIESSCDETSAAVIHNGKVLSNSVASQFDHVKYGGVVPELASRAHQENIMPIVEQSLKEANITKNSLKAVAYTTGPGLMGALLVGSSFAKGLAFSLHIPLIGVDHMQAHILAHFIEPPVPEFPFLCLTVSGGHTQIVLVENHLKMKEIGRTRDDAAGEAFDKAARLLGFPYPGGPNIDKASNGGDPFKFPFPDANIPDYDYSFSGIKTAIMYFLRKEKELNPAFIEENMADICASIQHCIVQMLMRKLKKAVNELRINQVGIAGGVSANSYLRKTVNEIAQTEGWSVFIPKLEYCTDNAAMIAMAAHYKYQGGLFTSIDASPDPNLFIT